MKQNGDINFLWPYYWDDTQYASPALADITGDGQTDIIMPGDSSPGGPVDWQGGMICALTGYEQNIWEFRTNEIVCSLPSIGDVNGDGDIEIMFGTGNYWAHNGGASDSTKVFVINRAGQLNCSRDIGAQARASPTLADFNGDDRLDIAFGTWQTSGTFANEGKVWVLDGATCNPIDGFPVASGGFLVLGQVVTADINHDGAQALSYRQQTVCMDLMARQQRNCSSLTKALRRTRTLHSSLMLMAMVNSTLSLQGQGAMA